MSACRHIIRAGDLSSSELRRIFERARHLKTAREGLRPLSRCHVALCFYEPSTRTWASFCVAAQSLGINVLPIINAAQFSSADKGETPGDTARVLSGLVGQYTGIIVMRHPSITAVDEAAAASLVPVINAGNGTDEHPTQAYLDLFTLFERFGSEERAITITLVGDLARGRTVHSLLKLLGLHAGGFVEINRVHLVAPEAYSLPPELLEEAQRAFPSVCVHSALAPGVLADSDVVYMTRPQRERDVAGTLVIDYSSFTLTPDLMRALPEKSVIMHPLPRNSELPTELDSDPRAFYFEQSSNGRWLRMALLEFLLPNQRSWS